MVPRQRHSNSVLEPCAHWQKKDRKCRIIECNVNPLLFQAGIRTVLVQGSANARMSQQKRA